MSYDKQAWVDGVAGGTPISANRLNHMEDGIDAAHTAIDNLDTGPMTGTGSPEGAEIAPVGTEYIDTAATNGALKWIKVSGVGNTGWKVLYGDTGWRDVSALVTQGFAGAVQNDTVWLRRVNDLVEVRISNAILNNQALKVNLGTQWNYGHPGDGRPVYITGGVLTYEGLNGNNSTANRAFVTFTTTAQWPTSLPGSAT